MPLPAHLKPILAALISPAAQAAVFCVGSPAELDAALTVARANGEADDVRVVAGTYALAAPLVYSTHQAFALTLSGRWNAGCTAQAGPSSILDGQGQHRILYAFSDATGDLAIIDLVFSNGRNTGAIAGGGLSIETSSRRVQVERNLFHGNQDTGSAGAARIAISTSDFVLVLRNNLVLGNRAPEGGGIVLNVSTGPSAFVTGNTILANTATLPGALCGGLCVGGVADFSISNNILWGNAGGDLHLGNIGSARLSSNDIGSLTGQPPAPGSGGNLSVPPGFEPGLLSTRLAPDSPLVNRGDPQAAGGLGALDAAQAPRLQGRSVDIGAFETDVLLRVPFEATPDP